MTGAGLRPVVFSEWTKLRTVRSAMIGLAVAVALGVTFTFLVANGSHEAICTGPPPPGAGPGSPGSGCHAGHPFVPTGPDGQAVVDSYQLVGQPLTGDATLRARVTAFSGVISANPANEAPSVAHTRPGLPAWAKAGILLTVSTRAGSSYAAVMATGGHGVRFQYDYGHDSAGLPGSVSGASPRWLRLTRSGDTVTGYDSPNATTWTRIGAARLAGLPATVSVGLFVTSPVSFAGSGGGAASRATASFDHVTLDGRAVPKDWQGLSVGTGSQGSYPTLGAGSYRRAGDTFALSGSGDIAPAVAQAGGDTASSSLVLGLVAAVLVLVVLATGFITGEYRRGLIRTTFTATPHRRRVLAAKAVVIATVAFVVGAVTAAVAVPLAVHVLDANGDYVFPTTALLVARVIAGSAALLALTAVAVLAVGTILRTGAGGVVVGVVVFVVPYVVGSLSSGGAGTWLFRVTPAAGFAVLGLLPRSALVGYPYTFANGYYPLSPLAGLAVLAGYAAIALGVAALVLERRDA